MLKDQCFAQHLRWGVEGNLGWWGGGGGQGFIDIQCIV